MAITAGVAAKRDELKGMARLLGENLSQRAFGECGPDLKVTLVDLEQLFHYGFAKPLESISIDVLPRLRSRRHNAD